MCVCMKVDLPSVLCLCLAGRGWQMLASAILVNDRNEGRPQVAVPFKHTWCLKCLLPSFQPLNILNLMTIACIGKGGKHHCARDANTVLLVTP